MLSSALGLLPPLMPLEEICCCGFSTKKKIIEKRQEGEEDMNTLDSLPGSKKPEGLLFAARRREI